MKRHAIVDRIRMDHPALPAYALISREGANSYRVPYIEELLRAKRGELSNLERQVARSLAEGDLFSANIERDYPTGRTIAERASEISPD